MLINAILKHHFFILPPQSAFSRRLGPFGFNHFKMLIVDLMHEFELGVWKSLFTHLLRILNAIDQTLAHELDRR